MALLTICDQNRTLSDEQEVRDYLVKFGYRLRALAGQ